MLGLQMANSIDTTSTYMDLVYVGEWVCVSQMGKPSCPAGKACGQHSAVWPFSCQLDQPHSQAFPHTQKRSLCEFVFSMSTCCRGEVIQRAKRQHPGFNFQSGQRRRGGPPRPLAGPAFNASMKVDGKQEKSPPPWLWSIICRARLAGFLCK